MNKEIHYEGWLIKSPPSKRIWRARWRRRYFTLKQGEIPEQFCLEYYTDRNCRKLKGVIDLDQCEQVDCGLRLENRKQKFQFMFDIKTPKRTYYLAADTEADMRDWVNCICQVCHLHDTKQSTEIQDDNQSNILSSNIGDSTNDTTTTTLNSTTTTTTTTRQSFNSDLLRSYSNIIDQQPQSSTIKSNTTTTATTPYSNNSDCAYVNTEYTNRETLLCDMRFDSQQLTNATTEKATTEKATTQFTPTSPSTALYLNSPDLQNLHSLQQTQVNSNEITSVAATTPTITTTTSVTTRLAVNSNGVVRKIPENLVLKNTPLPDSTQSLSVQPSPALSTASGPYIPISECFSGSPKFATDNHNPTTPLNNLDPKFYDTPRSHQNIGLNLINDQSYSPKITNCSVQQIATAKNRNHRSDSDSESVFTDDDEWTHPLPLRENVDRSTRPSDSSVENESFVLTYSQRFSKLPDDFGKEQKTVKTPTKDPLDKLAKSLRKKNNLILDFKDNEKILRDLPQLSDTENTSPAIGPRDATSVVEESYDIPRSHQKPYCNMTQFHERSSSIETNPIAASTPNLLNASGEINPNSPAISLRTLPRPHCYTNAAPVKIEGNVFRYDFGDLPPVNRKLKPKISIEDKPPEEVPPVPKPVTTPPATVLCATEQNSPKVIDTISSKMLSSFTNLYSRKLSGNTDDGNSSATKENASPPLIPPSVDRKLKPSAYKVGYSATMSPATRRSTGAPLSMVLTNDAVSYGNTVLCVDDGGYVSRTLPRQQRTTNSSNNPPAISHHKHASSVDHTMSPTNVFNIVALAQHQRTASAVAAMQTISPTTLGISLNNSHMQPIPPPKNDEHKLQYFDLDVANAPAINRQSMSVGNLNTSLTNRLGIAADPAARAPVKSSVVYNSVDFVKTEAFKRIREEREKESENTNSSNNSGVGTNK